MSGILLHGPGNKTNMSAIKFPVGFNTRAPFVTHHGKSLLALFTLTLFGLICSIALDDGVSRQAIGQDAKADSADAAIERTRKTVRMLDDIYKGGIVAITANYEKEESADGKRVLRVATPVPVVFEKCIMCHDNYADVPAGQAIGALTYSIEIE